MAMDYLEHTSGDDLSAAESYVTMFLGRLNLATRRLSFVDAGHGYTFVRRADGRVEGLAPRNLPLGVPASKGFDEGTIDLNPGDTVVVLSDGILEAYPGPGFDREGIAREIENSTTAAEAVAKILAVATAETAPLDDLTVVVLRCLDEA